MDEKKYSFYLTTDLPIPYRELLFYPIKVKDYGKFTVVAQSLILEKNSIPDVNIISMTYLKYLIEISKNVSDGVSPIELFDALLRMSLNIKEDEITYGIDSSGSAYFLIRNEKYNSDDFENIREIIAIQNELELPDETIQKSVRDEIEKAKRYKQKMSGGKNASLEEQIVALSVLTGWSLSSVYDMPIRKFIMAIRRADHILHSKIYLNASLSGMVTFKDKSVVKHWLAEINNNNDENVIVDLKDLQSKIGFEGAK